jgi:hypothetical protein
MKKILIAVLSFATISSTFAHCDLTLRIQGINVDGAPILELNIKDVVKLTKKLTRKGYNIVEVKSILDRSIDNTDYTATFSTNGLGGILSNSNVYMSNQKEETIVNESKTAYMRDGLMYRRLVSKIPSCHKI